jgi:hypothetical protein
MPQRHKELNKMADDAFTSLGVMVTPVRQEGVSPFKVQFQIRSSELAKKFTIDFGDGTGDDGDLVKGQATVEHTYSFIKTGKYNGTTYLPTVIVAEDGGEYPTSTKPGAFYVGISAAP